MSKLDMHIEFKWLKSDDPFVRTSSIPAGDRADAPFLGYTENDHDTLGQIGVYVAAQLASQFRTHVFSLFILRDTARIIRWDREGAVVTEPIFYNQSPLLAEFFSRYSMASSELRGVDTSVSPASEEEATRARIKLNLPTLAPMLKTTVPKNSDRSPFPVIFSLPEVFATTPACRGTRACPAYDPSKDRVVFLKDSWRVHGPDMVPEGDIYANLNRHNVPYVPTCIASGDVQFCPGQETQTMKYSRSPWACGKGVLITAHTHYRLVLEIVGEKLTNFASTKELVQAIYDALIGKSLLRPHRTMINELVLLSLCVAHKKAYEIGYLHRDISAGNIIIFDGHGWLIDWDLAKARDVPRRRQATRTVRHANFSMFRHLMSIGQGTWQFMSARLVEDRNAHHTYKDDLESAFWVLLWTAVMFSESSFSVDTRSEFIKDTFEAGGKGKRALLVFGDTINYKLFPNRSLLVEILKDLQGLFAYDYYTPTEDDWKLLQSFVDVSGREKQLVEALSVSRHLKSCQRLENHDYVIACFARHLNSEPWPQDDAAVAQLLKNMNCWGDESSGHVMVLKSKHVLVRVAEEEKEEGRSRKRLRGG